jgi:hypothetical protein
MYTILLDTFTDSIAVICSEEQCIINYFNSIEDALKLYPKAIVDPSLSQMKVSIDTNVCIKLINQEITLTKEQAITLREILNSI